MFFILYPKKLKRFELIPNLTLETYDIQKLERFFTQIIILKHWFRGLLLEKVY
jgi:hypothetical protein